MALLSVANLVFSIGDRLLLDGVNLSVEAGEHVGLVGRNGCGKSTLLKIIAQHGNLRADAGQVQLARSATAGYLTQDPQLDPTRTLREEAVSALGHLHALHEKIEAVAEKMATAEGEALEQLLKRYERLEERVEAAGGYAVEHEVEATLHGVGLGDEFFNVPVSGLSGGQKGRLALAKLLLAAPDVLLLDEPTNHLDIAGRQWLEGFLAGYRGAVILVSHDRWLLDRSVDRIYELDRGQLEEYPGNYGKYRELRAERRLAQQRDYEKQRDMIKREQQFIDRYRAGQRSKQAKGREKRLERYVEQERLDKPVELDAMSLRLAARSRSGDNVVAAHSIAKGYDSKQLFDQFTLTIKRGDRLGIIGPNGAGKSTLVNCMLGELPPDRGTVKLGAQVDVGYYRQTHEHLDLSLTVIDYLRRFVANGTEQEARDLAGAFLFSGLDQDKPLGSLSGGERSRAVLAGLMSQGHNLLVLDEPTNHLDIPSAERLEEALSSFAHPPRQAPAGTLLLITHDRMLLENIVNQLLIFDGRGGVHHFEGTYSEYLEWLARNQTQAAPTPPDDKKAAPPPAAKKQAGAAPRQKPQPRSNGGRFSKMSQQKLEGEIERLEKGLKKIDEELLDPQVYTDGEKVRKLQDKRAAMQVELEPLEEEWARRAETE